MTKPLGRSQIVLLHALAKSKSGLTKKQLADQTGESVSSFSLGPVKAKTLGAYPDSLWGRGLVEKEGNSYRITKSGLEVTKGRSPRKRPIPSGTQIPAELLDPSIRKSQSVRNYGLDRFTDEDVKEVLARLPEEYHEYPIDSVRQQMVNRTKRRAFVNEDDCKIRALKRLEKELGADGTVIKGLLTGKQILQIDEMMDELTAKKNKG